MVSKLDQNKNILVRIAVELMSEATKQRLAKAAEIMKD